MSKEVWYRVIVGDDTGLIKEVAFSQEDDEATPRILNTWGIQAADSAITQLTALEDSLVTYLRGNKTIELFSYMEAIVKTSFTIKDGHIVSIRFSPSEGLSVVTSTGELLLFKSWTEGKTKDVVCTKLPVDRVDCATWSEDGLYVSSNLTPNPQLIKDGHVIWTAKNQPDTKLGVTAKFQATSLVTVGNQLIAGDVQGQVRVYNHHVQRKAIFEIKNVFGKSSNHNHASDAVSRTRPVTCLTSLEDGKTVLCADTMGTLVGLDLDSKDVKYGFRGVMGSIRDVRLSGDNLYCVSAGRYIYKLNAAHHRTSPNKMFLKQKLTSVCVISDVEIEVERPSKKKRSNSNDESDQDEDNETDDDGEDEDDDAEEDDDDDDDDEDDDEDDEGDDSEDVTDSSS